MFSSDSFTQDMLSNPSLMASTIIDAMVASDASADPITINDPNNGLVMMLSANLAIYSKFSEKVDHVASFFYPQRARNAEQLYPHLSEFDYVELMAAPATLPFVFAMSRDWIIANAVPFDSNYDKIQIPATSAITMGGVIYSMYYPIELLVNRNTGAVSAFYDTTTPNSLNTLSTNMLLDVQQYTQNGLNWFQIQFNMYQFERTIKTYTVGSEQGFIRTVTYEDQFYAAKVFTQNRDLSWTELAYSLSQLYYDYTVPTVVLSLLNDTSQLKLEIPQIYFDNGQISQTIKVELYTTKGMVNYTLSQADVLGLTANFDTSSTPFARPLDQMPSWVIIPTTTAVAGGSDAMTYAEIRDAVVNQRLHDRVAVTTAELIEAGKKAGFNLTRVIDDLTERMYFASNVLTDSNGMVIPTFAGNILLANDSLTGDPSSIIDFSDGYITILPTTTFKIPNGGLTCVPMTDGEVAVMAAMTKDQLVAELNKGTYVRQPFHITLLTVSKSPQAIIYNLLSPTMTSLSFVAENAHSSPQMSVTSCAVVHQNSGTGGYLVNLGVTRSTNIPISDLSNFNVTLVCKNKLGSDVYIPATFIGTNNGVDVWQAAISTSYHISVDDFITTMMYDSNDTLSSADVPLTQTFTVLTSFASVYDLSIPVDANLNLLLPSSMQTTQTVMARQTMILELGENLSSQIYCGVNTTWGNDVYKTADSTVYYTTNVPVFQTNEAGVIQTSVNATTHAVSVVILYPEGATPSATGDIDVVTTADVTVPSSGTTTTFPIVDGTGLLVGMPFRGINIPVGALVTACSSVSVTISKLITATVPKSSSLVATNPNLLLRTSTAQTAAGITVTVPSTTGMLIGQSVFGFNIPTGTKIATIPTATTFTLSAPTTAILPVNTLLTVLNTTAHGVIKIAKGDVVTDVTGNPIIIKDAQNQYSIPSILFDGRIYASDNPSDKQLVTTISQYIQNYAHQIATIDAGLIEDSEVYYKPARTMGNATFGIGNSQTITLPLGLGFSVVVYVDEAIANNADLLSAMRDSITSIVNTGIQQPIISISAISTDIQNALGTNAAAVEMGGINGVDSLRLIALEQTDGTPGIEYILSVQPDGSIMRSPNIAISFLPKPDTSISQAINAS